MDSHQVPPPSSHTDTWFNEAHVHAQLIFAGCCEEALDWYQQRLGAQIEMMLRYDDSPVPLPDGSIPKAFGNRIMHATFRVGGTRLMASDDPHPDTRFSGFRLVLNLKDSADCRQAFEGLSEGGKVIFPLTQTFWTPLYAIVEDKFGIQWTLQVSKSPAPNPSMGK